MISTSDPALVNERPVRLEATNATRHQINHDALVFAETCLARISPIYTCSPARRRVVIGICSKQLLNINHWLSLHSDGAQSNQNKPITLPCSFKSILQEDGAFGSPGMVIMSPQTMTTNSAPAASRIERGFMPCQSVLARRLRECCCHVFSGPLLRPALIPTNFPELCEVDCCEASRSNVGSVGTSM